jgi:colicin import membrane protein
MRPVEYKAEDIIQSGIELLRLGRKVSGFSLRQKVGGGNPKRLEQVWHDYLTSQGGIKVEPATELPSEIAEAVRIVGMALTEQLSRLAIDLNDKAVKAAERRMKEGISTAGNQRKQAERELPAALQIVEDLEAKIDELKANAEKLEKKLADAQAVNQLQFRELAELKERLILAEQTEKTVSEQHSSERERLRHELNEQKHINQILVAKNDEAHKQTAMICEETTISTGQFETTKAPTTELKQVLSGWQQGTKIQVIDRQKNQLPNPNPKAYRFNQ